MLHHAAEGQPSALLTMRCGIHPLPLKICGAALGEVDRSRTPSHLISPECMPPPLLPLPMRAVPGRPWARDAAGPSRAAVPAGAGAVHGRPHAALPRGPGHAAGGVEGLGFCASGPSAALKMVWSGPNVHLERFLFCSLLFGLFHVQLLDAGPASNPCLVMEMVIFCNIGRAGESQVKRGRWGALLSQSLNWQPPEAAGENLLKSYIRRYHRRTSVLSCILSFGRAAAGCHGG
jgi:hypothetical protein